MVQLDSGQFLDRFNGAGRAAYVQRAVDDRPRRVVLRGPGAGADVAPLLARGLIDEQVPRDGQHGRMRVSGVEVNDKQVVRVRGTRIHLVAEVSMLPEPLLRADYQD